MELRGIHRHTCWDFRVSGECLLKQTDFHVHIHVHRPTQRHVGPTHTHLQWPLRIVPCKPLREKRVGFSVFSSPARLFCPCGVSVAHVLGFVIASLLPASVLSGWNPKSGSVPGIWDLAEVLTWHLPSSLMFLPEGHPSSPGFFGWERVSFRPVLTPVRMGALGYRLEWTVFITLDISLGVRDCWGQTLYHYRVPQFTKKKKKSCPEMRKAERTHQEQSQMPRCLGLDI